MTRLSEMAARKHITLVQAEAGRLFAQDAEAGSPLRHADMARVRTTKATGFSMVGLDRHRYHQALAMLGPLREIAVLVCVEDRPAKDWSDARGEPRDAALPLLRLALDQLVGFYQLTVAA